VSHGARPNRQPDRVKVAVLGAVLWIAACGGDVVVDAASNAARGTCETVCAAGPYTCTAGSKLAATLTIKVTTATGCTAVLSTPGQPDRNVDLTCSTSRGCILPHPSPCGLPCMGPDECTDLAITEPGLTFTLGAFTCQ
jgi:hypothetical protein